MTLLLGLLVGGLLLAIVAAELFARRMQAELRQGRPGHLSTDASASVLSRNATLMVAASSAQPMHSVAGTTHPTVANASSGSGPAVRAVLGYPALLQPLYEGLSLIPEVGWNFAIEPVAIEQFDSPDRLLTAAETLPLIEMPVFALLNFGRRHPDKLRVMGRSFSAGTLPHRPFTFVCRKKDDIDECHSATALRGRTVGVLGHYMSPTIALSRALKELDIEAAVWETNAWPDREPDEQRVDILVGGTVDGQAHALKSGQVDYALVIYPYTHRQHGAGFNDSNFCAASIVDLEDRMGHLLSSQTLNMMVTHAGWYEESDEWRTTVDALKESVIWKNEFLGNADESDIIHDVDGPVEEALVSAEVNFDTAGVATPHIEELKNLAAIGAGMGLWRPGGQLGLVA